MENQKPTAKCPKCGEEIWVGDEFCCNCGVSLVEAESVLKQKKKRPSKKRIAIVVGTIVAALCISVCGQFDGGDYLFDIIKTYPDGAHAKYCAQISKYRGKESNITTPDHVLWFPVTEIGDRAFYDNSSIKQVVVSEGVTTIGEWAFTWSSLERIELSDGVTTIEEWAFAETNITSFEMPDSVRELGRAAFCNCDNLTSYTLSKNLDYLPEWTFAKCDALEEVIICDNIKSIGAQAFAGCDNLKTVIMPEDTTYEADIIDESPNATIIQYTKNPF